MKQDSLINTAPLASARSVNAARRQRLRDQLRAHIAKVSATISNKSPMTAGARSTALPATGPASGVNASPGSSRANGYRRKLSVPDWAQNQIGLPDEDRYVTLDRLEPCSNCGHRPALWTETVSGKKKFSVRCHALHAGCLEQSTPWLDTSADAIRCWQLAHKLAES